MSQRRNLPESLKWNALILIFHYRDSMIIKYVIILLDSDLNNSQLVFLYSNYKVVLQLRYVHSFD